MLGAKVLLSSKYTIGYITLQGNVTTYAGVYFATGVTLSDGFIRSKASKFKTPSGIAIDSAGNIYVSESTDHVIRKIDLSGATSTFVGTRLSSGNVDGVGTNSKLFSPSKMAFDPSGNLFVSTAGIRTIRKITPDGTVTTYAGQSGLPGQVDGPAISSKLNSPAGIRSDSAGNIFVCDYSNHNIRKIDTSGNVTTFAGSTAAQSGTVNAIGTAARFSSPNSLEIDSSDNLYVGDNGTGNIRKITPDGTVTTFVAVGASWNANALAFNSDQTVLYLCFGASAVIKKLTMSTKAIVTYSGTTGVAGQTDTTIANSLYGTQSDLVCDSNDNIYVCDSGTYNTIRKIIPSIDRVTTYQGYYDNVVLTAQEGFGTAARFTRPLRITTDSNSNMYITDSNSHNIRKIDTDGLVTTFAGSISGASGSADGNGTNARFNQPYGIICDSNDNVYVADRLNHTIRKITPAGDVTTLVGTVGTGGYTDGIGTAVKLNYPFSLECDPNNNLYVGDNGTIRKFTTSGTVTTFVGSSATGYVDGTGTAAKLAFVYDMTLDSNGNLFIISTLPTIRKITPAGVVTTFAGNSGIAAHVNGTGTAARFNSLDGITIDKNDVMYVSETDGALANRIRKILPTGVVSDLAGFTVTGSTDGTGTVARFNAPTGMVIDSTGVMYVCDNGNSLIRKVT